MTPAQVAHITPPLPFAVFDEFGKSCEDRVADHYRAAVEAALRDAPQQAEPEGCTPADAAMLRRANHALAAENDALRAQQRPAIEYTPGEWFDATTVDLMEAFYLSRLPAIREAAKEHGYAIGVHGSMRRDLDLIAAPWRDGASNADTLVEAIQKTACGFTQSKYQWEQKPAGRVSISVPICWTYRHGVLSDGHIDLSVLAARPSAPTAVEPDERAEFEAHIHDRHEFAPEWTGVRYREDVFEELWTTWQAARASKGTP